MFRYICRYIYRLCVYFYMLTRFVEECHVSVKIRIFSIYKHHNIHFSYGFSRTLFKILFSPPHIPCPCLPSCLSKMFMYLCSDKTRYSTPPLLTPPDTPAKHREGRLDRQQHKSGRTESLFSSAAAWSSSAGGNTGAVGALPESKPAARGGRDRKYR